METTNPNTKKQYWFPPRDGYPSLSIDQVNSILDLMNKNDIPYLPEFYSYCLEIEAYSAKDLTIRLYYKDTYTPVPLKLNDKVTLEI